MWGLLPYLTTVTTVGYSMIGVLSQQNSTIIKKSRKKHRFLPCLCLLIWFSITLVLELKMLSAS